MTDLSHIQLSKDLYRAGLGIMALAAGQKYYHDFESPMELPAIALDRDLKRAAQYYLGTDNFPRIKIVIEKHYEGAYDATTEESEVWAKGPEGRAAARGLMKVHKK